MKSIAFSSLDPVDIERLKEAQCAGSFMFIFKQILQSLYYEDCFVYFPERPVMGNTVDLLGFDETNIVCPTMDENLRFYPSADAFNKLEKHFRIVRRYVVLLKRPHSLCGRWKIRRKIRKTSYDLSLQEFYSAIIYLFMHKGLGTVEDFKTLLKEK